MRYCSLFPQGVTASCFDPCILIHTDDNINITVFVDDIGRFGLLSPLVEKTIKSIKENFEVKDLGVATRLLGIQIQYEMNSIFLS